MGGNGDPSPAELASSPGSEYFGIAGGDGVSPGGTNRQGASGVKRTRSIMQRFKAMVSDLLSGSRQCRGALTVTIL